MHTDQMQAQVDGLCEAVTELYQRLDPSSFTTISPTHLTNGESVSVLITTVELILNLEWIKQLEELLRACESLY